MRDYIISINQMAEFSSATEAGKRRIITQQLNPNKIKISYYQMPKARVKKSLALKGDLKPVFDGINTLLSRQPVNKRQETDKTVSIEAMERFIQLKLPKILKEIDYSVIKPEKKTTTISDVKVIVSPDLIIKGLFNGQTVMGALKIHISKHKPFDLQKSQIVSTTIYKYLQNEIVDDSAIVLPELCFCLDIFSGRMVSAKDAHESKYNEIIELCDEIKRFWDVA
ncbi:MAG: hypothetical protein AB7S69_12070 [Salinivirgaceae bacterium]